jgi:hypothetical protein
MTDKSIWIRDLPNLNNEVRDQEYLQILLLNESWNAQTTNVLPKQNEWSQNQELQSKK